MWTQTRCLQQSFRSSKGDSHPCGGAQASRAPSRASQPSSARVSDLPSPRGCRPSDATSHLRLQHLRTPSRRRSSSSSAEAPGLRDPLPVSDPMLSRARVALRVRADHPGAGSGADPNQGRAHAPLRGDRVRGPARVRALRNVLRACVPRTPCRCRSRKVLHARCTDSSLPPVPLRHHRRHRPRRTKLDSRAPGMRMKRARRRRRSPSGCRIREWRE